jgi:hypothetical protein
MHVNIWDVDGCFVLHFETTYNEAENTKKIKKQPKCIPFCEYARRESVGAINYVVTGRKELALGKFTRELVSEYNENPIFVFFPEYKLYNQYHDWKKIVITEIIDEHENKIIKMYDDDKKVIGFFLEDDRVITHFVYSDPNNFEFRHVSLNC